ncbi:MAG: hypothetical protein V4642_06480 [Bacteroidota bacterium]
MLAKSKIVIMTPEQARKEMKRKEMLNWIMFFGFLLLVTIGVLELITSVTS